MKNIKYILMTLLVSVVAITGCGKKNSLSPKETFEKTAESMQKVENFKMNANVNVGLKAGESEIVVKLTLDALADIKNGKMHMNMDLDALGEKANVEAYADFKNDDNEMIMYVKDEEGNWTKSTEELSEETATEMSTEVFDALESSKMLKEVKADKENYNYEITVNKETIKSLMKTLDASEALEDMDIDSLEGDIVVTISVDQKTYNLKKISIDMKDMIDKLMSSLGEQAEGMEISKAEFIMTFDYENVGTVEIPDEVIEAAEEDDYDFDYDDTDFGDVFEFDEEDYEEILSCSMTESEEGVEATTDILVGFNDDISVAGYYDLGYTFENIEDAEEFYDSYEREPYEMVLQGGNSVFISGSEEFDTDLQMSYSDAKSYYESIGMVCE